MNLRQPARALREFYDFDAKFHGLDHDVMWPLIRLVVSVFPASLSSCVSPASVSERQPDDPWMENGERK